MTSKDVAKLYPLAFGQPTTAQLVDATDSIQVLWHFILRALTGGRDQLDPGTITTLSSINAASAQMAAQVYDRLAVLAEQIGTRPDLYGHTDGSLTDCTDMAGTLLREVSTQLDSLTDALNGASRFTACVHTKQPKTEVTQQDS